MELQLTVSEYIRKTTLDFRQKLVDGEVENELDFILRNVTELYLLSRQGDNISCYIEKIRAIEQYEKYIDWFFDDPQRLLYIYKMGLSDSYLFKTLYEELIKDVQTVRGFIHANSNNHVGPMRVMIAYEPENESTTEAINYFINNFSSFNVGDQAIGIIGLFEHNYYLYKDILQEMIGEIKNYFNGEQFILGDDSVYSFPDKAYLTQAIGLVCGYDDPIFCKSKEYLESKFNEIKEWIASEVALILRECGNGKTISYSAYERLEKLHNQKMDLIKPELVMTLPYNVQFSIKDKVKQMLYSRTKRIWIASRYITEFWTDLVIIKEKYPEIDIKVLTLPSKDSRAKIYGEGKKYVELAVETLQKKLESNFKTSSFLHARFIVTDAAVLISSADLTIEQLEKEVNLGVFSRNPDLIKSVEKIYQELWVTKL